MLLLILALTGYGYAGCAPGPLESFPIPGPCEVSPVSVFPAPLQNISRETIPDSPDFLTAGMPGLSLIPEEEGGWGQVFGSFLPGGVAGPSVETLPPTMEWQEGPSGRGWIPGAGNDTITISLADQVPGTVSGVHVGSVTPDGQGGTFHSSTDACISIGNISVVFTSIPLTPATITGLLCHSARERKNIHEIPAGIL